VWLELELCVVPVLVGGGFKLLTIALMMELMRSFIGLHQKKSGESCSLQSEGDGSRYQRGYITQRKRVIIP